MNHPSVKYGSSNEGASSLPDDLALHPLAIFTCVAVVGRQLKYVALTLKYHRVVRIAKPRR
jgi:hypothetical protein